MNNEEQEKDILENIENEEDKEIGEDETQIKKGDEDDKEISIPEENSITGSSKIKYPEFKSFSKVDRDLLLILSFLFVAIILFLGLASFFV